MTLIAVQRLTSSMDRLAENGSVQIDLWSWVKHELMASTTNSVYGAKNPFRDLSVVDAFLSVMPDSTCFFLIARLITYTGTSMKEPLGFLRVRFLVSLAQRLMLDVKKWSLLLNNTTTRTVPRLLLTS